MKNALSTGVRRLLLASAFGVALVGAGCAEKPQDAPLKSGKYLGKPDTRPWEGSTLVFESGEFKRGEKSAWESAMRTRAQNQNEYSRAQ